MSLKLSSPKIWLATEAFDFRRGINGLCEIVQSHFSANLKEGIFIFYSRDRKKLKLLTWHGNGFVLICKRLERGCFTVQPSKDQRVELDEKQLSWLLAGLDWFSMSTWKELEFNDFY
jgi:transposase